MVRPLFLPVCGFLLVASMAMAQSEHEPVAGISVFKQGQLVGKVVGAAPETEMFSYQVPGFEPSMLETMDFRFGSVVSSESANGSGTNVPFVEDDGLLWAEVEKLHPLNPSQATAHRFVTAVNILDGSGYLFVDQQTMNMAEVAGMLTKLYRDMYFVLNPQIDRMSFMRSAPRHIPTPEMHSVEATIDGAWLSIADVQEQVFQQTRCHLELDQSVYYLAGCEP